MRRITALVHRLAERGKRTSDGCQGTGHCHEQRARLHKLAGSGSGMTPLNKLMSAISILQMHSLGSDSMCNGTAMWGVMFMPNSGLEQAIKLLIDIVGDVEGLPAREVAADVAGVIAEAPGYQGSSDTAQSGDRTSGQDQTANLQFDTLSEGA